MSSWREERRLDNAAEAQQRREDRAFEAQLRREERQAAKEEERAEQARLRRDKAQRKAARAAKREKTLTPGNVYKRGTLILVALSALAAIPAQVAYFAGISLMLLPVPFALEGAAWVMAAGVAHADERKLAGWVRWLLRGFCISAAGFAARINYLHGVETSQTVGWGLAAVTMLGPLFFEVRQWVTTLSAATGDPRKRAEEKARAKHERDRRRTFKDVAERQKQILLAAPYGTVRPEAAWKSAWADIKGAPVPVTAEVVARRLEAEASVAEVLAEAERTPERIAVELLLADIFGSSGGDAGPSGNASPNSGDGPRGGDSQGRTALGGKGKRRIRSTSATPPVKPLEEADLEAVRKLADALGDTGRLSARNIREAVGCRTEYAIRLRDAVTAERTATTDTDTTH